MASTFTWLDYSEHDRRQMLDVIDRFAEQETRDELGVGTVRDAFADLLFPGTSTIQTRAGYFLFVPWIYLDLERRRASSSEVAQKARRSEVALMTALAEAEDNAGAIGKQAREKLKRLASSVYWQGLQTWGIFLRGWSQEQYHRSLDAFHRSLDQDHRNDDGEPVEGHVPRNWHAGLPEPPATFPEETSFLLRGVQAEYLRERILARVPRTLLAFLVDQGQPADDVSYPWQHPQFGEFPPHIREQLEHGRNFSETIHGAALLYNLMLAQRAKWKDRIEHYQGKVQEWAMALEERQAVLANWNRRRFWEIVFSGRPRVTPQTRLFIDNWLNLALEPGNARAVSENERARRLIQDREHTLKRGLARLENPRALELWRGAAGTSQIDFRWTATQRIVADILQGLSPEERYA